MKAKLPLLTANIKNIRRLDGITQEDFARLLKVKRSAIGAYEEGRSQPSIETLIVISDLYRISIDDLLRIEILSKDQLYGNSKSDLSFSIKDNIHEVKRITEGLKRTISKTLNVPVEISVVLTVKASETL